MENLKCFFGNGSLSDNSRENSTTDYVSITNDRGDKLIIYDTRHNPELIESEFNGISYTFENGNFGNCIMLIYSSIYNNALKEYKNNQNRKERKSQVLPLLKLCSEKYLEEQNNMAPEEISK